MGDKVSTSKPLPPQDERGTPPIQQPADSNAPRVLVICGPTATGKTACSVTLAKMLDGEIICADSMQIYKQLSVGTAKATVEEMQGIPHHLMDFLSPDEVFSVADYVKAAHACIAQIASRGKLPILVGGTGLYIQSLLQGVVFSPQKTDPEMRAALQARLVQQGIGPLYEELCAVDPVYAATLHPNNHGRVLRALELYLHTGKTMSEQLAQSLPARRPYRSTIACLNFANRNRLYARIDARVQQMMAGGLLDEARLVYDHREAYRTAAQAIGYKEFFPYFEENALLSACVAALQQASRNYAKRQLTWFRRMEGVHWLQADSATLCDEIVSALRL